MKKNIKLKAVLLTIITVAVPIAFFCISPKYFLLTCLFLLISVGVVGVFWVVYETILERLSEKEE